VLPWLLPVLLSRIESPNPFMASPLLVSFQVALRWKTRRRTKAGSGSSLTALKCNAFVVCSIRLNNRETKNLRSDPKKYEKKC
jgi:hypothetical protein